MLRKFEQFITYILAVVLVWMLLIAPTQMHNGQQTFPVYNSMVVSRLVF